MKNLSGGLHPFHCSCPRIHSKNVYCTSMPCTAIYQVPTSTTTLSWNKEQRRMWSWCRTSLVGQNGNVIEMDCQDCPWRQAEGSNGRQWLGICKSSKYSILSVHLHDLVCPHINGYHPINMGYGGQTFNTG